jgi:hypothetical protein
VLSLCEECIDSAILSKTKALSREKKMDIPIEIALGEQPRSLKPLWIPQLLQLFVVVLDILLAIFLKRPVQPISTPSFSSKHFKVRYSRHDPIMLQLIFELQELLDDLLPLLYDSLIGVVLVGAEYIVECLVLSLPLASLSSLPPVFRVAEWLFDEPG